jgi:hypothetical protein
MNHENIFLHLGRLEGKVDAILANQTLMAKQLDHHDQRLGKLENYKAYLIGVSATVGAGMSWLMNTLRGGHS